MRIEQPIQASHTFRQDLVGTPERIFPLLCPVREAEWVDGWDPELVVTASGVIEPGCLFVTDEGEGEDAVWVTVEHDPESWRVGFVKVTPGHTVGRIEIQLQDKPGPGTYAYVTYSYTALSESGRAFIEAFDESHYQGFMQEWELALNHYLRTGDRLSSGFAVD